MSRGNFDENNVWPGVVRMWDALRGSYNIWSKKPNGESLVFNEEAKDEFIARFSTYYNDIKSRFMVQETKGLDAHKQAAIMIKSALDSKAVEQSPCDEGKIALGPQAVILDVAISFLESSINDKLKEIGVSPIKFKLPVALACETSYFNILRRILYYEAPNSSFNGIPYDMSYNIIEWSERFFLLEYITLLSNGIDPLLVKDSFRTIVNN